MKIARKLTLYAWIEGGLITYLVEIDTPAGGPVSAEAYSLDTATRAALKLADDVDAAEESVEAR